MHLFLRSLAAGLLWSLVTFVIDSIESAGLLQRSSKHIRTDAATLAALTEGVLDYMRGIVLAHLILGVIGGIGIFAVQSLWFPVEPSKRRWWLSVAVGATFTTLGIYLQQMIHFPNLHDWAGTPIAWVDFWESPQRFERALAGLVLFVLAVAAWRWRDAGRGFGGFAARLGGVGAWLGASAALLHHPAPRPIAAPPPAGPNVVLIGVDSLRPDHLGHFGYDRATAPNIDALLRESVIFTSAWTVLPRTYPAWMSTLSGQWPRTHGVRDNLPEPEHLVPPVALLPQVLRDKGYATAFVTDDSRFSYMVPGTGFDTIVQPELGVQNFAVSVNEPRYKLFHALMHNPIGFRILPSAAYNQAFGKSYRPDLFIDKALDALAEVSAQGKPVFYAVHSCVLHAPGDRAWPWHQMFGQNGYRLERNRFRYSRSGSEVLDEDEETGEQVNIVAAQDVRIYDSGIDMADRLVARTVDELKRSGMWDNTIVILFSDHGEEHWAPDLPYKFGGPNHGFHMYGTGQSKVVWAIRFPEGMGPAGGQTVDAPVRLIDMGPTILDLLGFAYPAPTDGASVMPLVHGQAEAEPRLVYIETGVSEPRYWTRGHRKYPFKTISQRYRLDPETGLVHLRPEFRPQLIAAKDRAVQVGPWKLVWHAMEEGVKVELFDIRTDPLNQHDLSLSMAPRVAALAARLAPFLRADGEDPPALAEWEAAAAAAGPAVLAP